MLVKGVPDYPEHIREHHERARRMNRILDEPLAVVEEVKSLEENLHESGEKKLSDEIRRSSALISASSSKLILSGEIAREPIQNSGVLASLGRFLSHYFGC